MKYSKPIPLFQSGDHVDLIPIEGDPVAVVLCVSKSNGRYFYNILILDSPTPIFCQDVSESILQPAFEESDEN